MLPPRMQARCDQSQCSHHHNLCRMNVISSGRVQSPLLCRDASLVSSSRSCLRDRPGSSRKGSTSQQCTDTPNPTIHIMLAGALVLNSLAVPWILSPAAAAEDSRALTPSAAAAASRAGTRQPSRRPIYAVADAPNVHAADPESAEQQMPWWQQDQQVWLELTSASELTAYLSSSQPPPAWPALESTALNPRLRLVEFYATWCPACKAAAPGMAEVAGDPYLRQHCSFARINIDRAKPLVRQLGITKIPTVMLLGPDSSSSTPLSTFRASGQAAREALQQQLAAMAIQQQQQQPAPLLPLPGGAGGDEGAEGQPAPSEVGDNNSNGSSSSNDNNNSSSAKDGATAGAGGSSSGSSSSSNPAGAACGVVPEPSCGDLPPSINPPPGSAADNNSSNSSTSALIPGSADTAPSSSAAEPSRDGGDAAATAAAAAARDTPVDPALLAAKQQFLQQYGSQYGYGGWLEQHYQQEIGQRLGPDNHYLDYTGAALYPASLLEAVYKDLLTQTYGNPHSAAAAAVDGNGGSSSSSTAAAPVAPAAASEAVLEAAAAAVLEHLHADPAEYQVVFTRSATDALRMVGELFPWSSGVSSSSSSSGESSSSAGRSQQQHSIPTELDMLSSGATLRQQQQQQLQQQGLLTDSPPPPTVASGLDSSNSSSNTDSSSSSRVSRFVYTRSNHNSVLGIGAYAAAAGAELLPQSDTDMEAWVAGLEQQQQQQQEPRGLSASGGEAQPTYNLLAYPAEDNFAGVVYPLDWINRVHAASSPQERTLVLLDAAAYLPTHELDLSRHPADFVVASFYKMFGYPTGLGMLVLRTEHVPTLNKVYFGGGSVALATPEGCWHVAKCDPAAALSDGTPNYLGAAALKLAYESWDSRGGMQAVEQHTQALSSWLHEQLSGLHHSNMASLIQLYGVRPVQGFSDHGSSSGVPEQAQRLNQQGSSSTTTGGFSQGPVFNFQVLRPDGQPLSFSNIDRDATAAGLYLRSGCVCNPGACYDAVGLDASEVQALAGLKEGCGDEMDFATVMRPAPNLQQPAAASQGRGWFWRGLNSSSGSLQQEQQEQQDNGSGLVSTQVPLGSVRVSLGWASTFEDAFALVQFLRGYLV